MKRHHIISTLNSLLEVTNDGSIIFRNYSRGLRKKYLMQTFESAARRCDTGAIELGDQIRKLGGKPVQSGSLLGGLRRAWMKFISTVTLGEEHVILEECERAEDAAMRVYEAALGQDLPKDIYSLIVKQYNGLKQNHDRIRALRNHAAVIVE